MGKTLTDGKSGYLGLIESIERQVERLIEIKAYKQIKIGKGKYFDELMMETKKFIWRPELAAIGLDKVALIDYRLSGEFLVKTGNVYVWINANPDKCKNYCGVLTPTGRPLIIQGQWGSKYCNMAPCWCRDNFHRSEQGLIVKEALTVYLYEGRSLIDIVDNCYIDIPGSVSERNEVPRLMWFGRPELCDSWSDFGKSWVGSASRGK